MTAGALAESLTIYKPETTADAQGGRSTDWTAVATVRAALQPPSADEILQTGAVSAQTDYRFLVRLRGDVTPAMRAAWTPTWPPQQAARTLEIHGVEPQADRAWMVLRCGAVS